MLVDIISAMGDYVLMYFQALGYLFSIVFNLPVGGIALGYIVIIMISISFVIYLMEYVLGGDE